MYNPTSTYISAPSNYPQQHWSSLLWSPFSEFHYQKTDLLNAWQSERPFPLLNLFSMTNVIAFIKMRLVTNVLSGWVQVKLFFSLISLNHYPMKSAFYKTFIRLVGNPYHTMFLLRLAVDGFLCFWFFFLSSVELLHE